MFVTIHIRSSYKLVFGLLRPCELDVDICRNCLYMLETVVATAGYLPLSSISYTPDAEYVQLTCIHIQETC